MTLKQRIAAMVTLGNQLREKDEYLEAIMHRTKFHNGWFTIENQKQSLEAISNFYLTEVGLRDWVNQYEIPERQTPKRVGIIMAGNIPLVGFHDLLSVFISGHIAQIKLSDKDPFLLPYLLKKLEAIDPQTSKYFKILGLIKDVDAVIATGSNNSARYFEQYFSKMPNVIRKNRNAVAVLTGEESKDDILALGQDIFQYFGLGCRNVSKVYVPAGYNLDAFLEILHDEYRTIIQHNKYKNNFDYNFAIHVLNKDAYKSNGCLIMVENQGLASRVGELYYQYFDQINQLELELENRTEEIQCIVAKDELLTLPTLGFGQAQKPKLWDYADGVDTMQFLINDV